MLFGFKYTKIHQALLKYPYAFHFVFYLKTINLGKMDDAYFKPIWIKALLGFALMMVGLLLTFLVFRFIPIPKDTGYDGLSSLMLILFCLGGIELLYILGVIFSRNHPYVIFSLCLIAFVIVLALVRWLVIG
jgi:hypothetical protein